MSPHRLVLPLAFAGLGLWACGSSTPSPNNSSGELLPMTTSSAKPTATSTATADAPPAASSAAPAASSAGKPARLPSSGGPMAVSEDAKEVTSPQGSGGGIIRIGTGAELTVPRGALSEPVGFTFGLNTGKSMLKITPYKGQIGDVYRIFLFKEDASNVALPTSSSGPPFVLKLSLKGAKTGNLVTVTSTDGKAKYTIIAPKSVQEGDGGPFAVFELPNLPGEAIFHLTNAPPG